MDRAQLNKLSRSALIQYIRWSEYQIDTTLARYALIDAIIKTQGV